jgi:hypothetical protein
LKIAPEAVTGAELLASHRDSKLIWVYQHFDVSALTRVHRYGVQDCRERFDRMLRQDEDGLARTWPYAPRIGVQDRADGGLSPYDVAALSWHLKNSEVFRLGLDCDPQVLLLSQAALLTEAKVEGARLRAFVGIGPHRVLTPGWNSEDAGTALVGSEAGSLSRAIREACEQLWDALERARKRQIEAAAERGSDRSPPRFQSA